MNIANILAVRQSEVQYNALIAFRDIEIHLNSRLPGQSRDIVIIVTRWLLGHFFFDFKLIVFDNNVERYEYDVITNFKYYVQTIVTCG